MSLTAPQEQKLKETFVDRPSGIYLLKMYSGQCVFPVMDSTTGMPTMREICYLLHRGEGEPPALWKSGRMTLPSEDAIRDDGNGWIVGSVVITHLSSEESAREKLLKRAEQIEALLSPAPAQA